MTDLSPCPWCNRPPKMEVINVDWCIYCADNGCPVEPFCFDAEQAKAISMWNTRPGVPIDG